MSIKELSQKPEKVVAAVKLLYVVVAIGIIRTSMTVIRHVDVRSPHLLIFSKMLIYAVSVFLIFQVSKGKKPGRRLRPSNLEHAFTGQHAKADDSLGIAIVHRNNNGRMKLQGFR